VPPPDCAVTDQGLPGTLFARSGQLQNTADCAGSSPETSRPPARGAAALAASQWPLLRPLDPTKAFSSHDNFFDSCL
jgi:hypothetical protein